METQIVYKQAKSWPGMKLDKSQKKDLRVMVAIVADVVEYKVRDITKRKIIKEHVRFFGATASRQAELYLEKMKAGATRNSEVACVADGVALSALTPSTVYDQPVFPWSEGGAKP